MINYDLVKAGHSTLSGKALLEPLIENVFPGRIALVSSFGAESSVLLHMVSEIDPSTPVIFLNTGKLFPLTVEYQKNITRKLGLSDVRVITPLEAHENALDNDGTLWQRSTDECCHFRKVLPLETALQGFQAWITGRKRFQGGSRTQLDQIETADWRVKVNPLASWNQEDIADYIKTHDLPRHPLTAEGYPSIGCEPCTIPAGGSDARSGRWANQDKTECGIHWSANGTPVRTNN